MTPHVMATRLTTNGARLSAGALSQYSSQSATRREVFQMPTEVSSSHSDAFFSGRTPSTSSFLPPSLSDPTCPTHRWHDDDHTAHGGGCHDDATDHTGGGSEERDGGGVCHQEDDLRVLRCV